jgi:hypothetical protein
VVFAGYGMQADGLVRKITDRLFLKAGLGMKMPGHSF